MKKSFKFSALLMASMLIFNLFALAAFAEPEESALPEESQTVEESQPIVDEPTESQPEDSAPIVDEPEESQPEESSDVVEESSEIIEESSEVIEESSEIIEESSEVIEESSEVIEESSEVIEESSEVIEESSEVIEESSEVIEESSEVIEESSEPEESEPVVEPEPEVKYNITFTITGKGTVYVYESRTDTCIATISEGTHVVTTSSHIYFNTNATVLDMDWNEPHRAVDDKYYYINPSKDSYVNMTIEGGTVDGNIGDTSDSGDTSDTSDAESFNVHINKTPNGYIVYTDDAGEHKMNGTGTIITIDSEEEIIFTVYPDEGYELSSFKVDNIAVELTDDSYTLSGVTKETKIMVTFKQIGAEDPEDPEIGVTKEEISWDDEHIKVEIQPGEFVYLSVFEEIKNLSTNSSEKQYVEFISENGTIFVPYGFNYKGTETEINASIELLDNEEYYNSIAANFNSDNSEFKVFVINEYLLNGTEIKFNLGSEFNNSEFFGYTYNSDTKTLVPYETKLKVTNGMIGGYINIGEIFVLSQTEANASLTISAEVIGEGGSISPEGTAAVEPNSSTSYTVRANNGYVIKSIYVDDVLIENAVGATNYIHRFENISESHTIKVEFEKNDTNNAPDSENQNSDQANGSNSSKVIAILVIIAVAVLGAAALFIVKWRSEKF